MRNQYRDDEERKREILKVNTVSLYLLFFFCFAASHDRRFTLKMPKYSYMISKAVELVARKLAGMDPETVSRMSNVLSEEAQAISDELNGTGQPVDADILATRLDGVVTRMKYEARNQVRPL